MPFQKVSILAMAFSLAVALVACDDENEAANGDEASQAETEEDETAKEEEDESAGAGHDTAPDLGDAEPFVADFFDELASTVNDHDWNLMMEEFIHPEYIREQHDQFLDGRTEQFLAELLFPGLSAVDAECRKIIVESSHDERLAMIEDFRITSVKDRSVHHEFTLGDTDCALEGFTFLNGAHDPDDISLSGPRG